MIHNKMSLFFIILLSFYGCDEVQEPSKEEGSPTIYGTWQWYGTASLDDGGGYNEFDNGSLIIINTDNTFIDTSNIICEGGLLKIGIDQITFFYNCENETLNQDLSYYYELNDENILKLIDINFGALELSYRKIN